MTPWQVLRASRATRAGSGSRGRRGPGDLVHYGRRSRLYLQQVQCLEITNQRLQHQIQEELNRKCPQYLRTASLLQDQISECLSAEAQLKLQLLAAELTVLDFGVRCEKEREHRGRVEAELSNLRMLQEALMGRELPELHNLVTNQMQRLMELQVQHQQDVQGLLAQMTGGVVMEMRTAGSSDLIQQVEDLRQTSVTLLIKNQGERWYNAQVSMFGSPEVTFDPPGESEVVQAQLEELRRTAASLEEEWTHLWTQNVALEASGLEQTESCNRWLVDLQQRADGLSRDLDSELQAAGQRAADHQVLLDVWSRLEAEIQDYRRLLDGRGRRGDSAFRRNIPANNLAQVLGGGHGRMGVQTFLTDGKTPPTVPPSETDSNESEDQRPGACSKKDKRESTGAMISRQIHPVEDEVYTKDPDLQSSSIVRTQTPRGLGEGENTTLVPDTQSAGSPAVETESRLRQGTPFTNDPNKETVISVKTNCTEGSIQAENQDPAQGGSLSLETPAEADGNAGEVVYGSLRRSEEDKGKVSGGFTPIVAKDKERDGKKGEEGSLSDAPDSEQEKNVLEDAGMGAAATLGSEDNFESKTAHTKMGEVDPAEPDNEILNLAAQEQWLSKTKSTMSVTDSGVASSSSDPEERLSPGEACVFVSPMAYPIPEPCLSPVETEVLISVTHQVFCPVDSEEKVRSPDSLLSPDKCLSPVEAEGCLSPVAAEGCLSPVKAEGCLSPVEAEGCMSPVNAEGCLSPVDAEGCMSTVEAEGWLSPVIAEGCLSPIDAEGCLSPVDADGCTSTVEAEGWLSPVNAEGCLSPVDAEGCTSTVEAEGCLSPVEAEGCLSPVEAEGCLSPVDAEGCLSPVEAEGCLSPVEAEGCLSPVEAEGGLSPVDAEGCLSPVDAEGCTSTVEAEGCLSPVEAEGCLSPVDDEGCTSPVEAEGCLSVRPVVKYILCTKDECRLRDEEDSNRKVWISARDGDSLCFGLFEGNKGSSGINRNPRPPSGGIGLRLGSSSLGGFEVRGHLGCRIRADEEVQLGFGALHPESLSNERSPRDRFKDTTAIADSKDVQKPAISSGSNSEQVFVKSASFGSVPANGGTTFNSMPSNTSTTLLGTESEESPSGGKLPTTRRFSSGGSGEWTVYGGYLGRKRSLDGGVTSPSDGIAEGPSVATNPTTSPQETGRFSSRGIGEWMVSGGRLGRRSSLPRTGNEEGQLGGLLLAKSPPDTRSFGSIGSLKRSDSLPITGSRERQPAMQLATSPPETGRFSSRGSGEWRVYGGGSGRVSGVAGSDCLLNADQKECLSAVPQLATSPPGGPRGFGSGAGVNYGQVISPPSSYTSSGPRLNYAGSGGRLIPGGVLRRSRSVGSGGRLSNSGSSSKLSSSPGSRRASSSGRSTSAGSGDSKPVYSSASGWRSTVGGTGGSGGGGATGNQRSPSPGGRTGVGGGWRLSSSAGRSRISSSSGSGKTISTGRRVISSSDRPIRSTGSREGGNRERISVCKMAALSISAAGRERSQEQRRQQQQQQQQAAAVSSRSTVADQGCRDQRCQT